MKSISAELVAHLAEPVTTMCLCFRVLRHDGVEVFLTGHDNDLVIDGDTYRSDSSFSATAADTKSGLNVDNSELTLPFTADGITKADAMAGLFYRSKLDIFWVNWDDLTMGKMWEAKGWLLGKATIKDHRVVFEVRSLAAALSAPILDLITPDCPYDFGVNDGYRSFCPANLNSYYTDQTVSSVDGDEPNRVFTVSSLIVG